ncbi:MAG: methionine--tRNA ligase, partial [Pseudomonadota bacterium]
KTDPDAAAAVVRAGLNLVRLYAILSRPFVPDAADAMLKALNLDANQPWPDNAEAALSALPPGHAFATPEVLFAKLTDERREELEARFAGQD